MSVELECPAHCDLGVGGAKYRTPALEFDFAFQMLDMHLADGHGLYGGGGGGAAAEGEGGVQLVRPSISRGCSQEEFEHFKLAWTVYVKISGETNDMIIRDQLYHCPDIKMRETLYRTLGDRVDTISVSDLLREIETLAVHGEDEFSSKVGVDANKSTVTWGMQLMLDREEILKKLAAQVKFENPSQVQINTDKFVATRGREHRHQFLLDKERKSVNAKSSQLERGQEGGASIKKIPKSDLHQGSCQVYVQEDTPTIVRLHNKQMVHEGRKQHHQPELGGSTGGQEGGASIKKFPKLSPCQNNEESCLDHALEDDTYTEGEDQFDKGFAVQLKRPRNNAMVVIDKNVQGENNADKANTAQFCEYEKSAVVAQDKHQPAMSNDKNILLSSDSGGQEGGACTKKIIPKPEQPHSNTAHAKPFSNPVPDQLHSKSSKAEASSKTSGAGTSSETPTAEAFSKSSTTEAYSKTSRAGTSPETPTAEATTKNKLG